MRPVVGMIVLFLLPSGKSVEAEVVRENPQNGFDLAIPKEAGDEVPELAPIQVAKDKVVVFGITHGLGAKHWQFGERKTPDFLEKQRVEAEQARRDAEVTGDVDGAGLAGDDAPPATA